MPAAKMAPSGASGPGEGYQKGYFIRRSKTIRCKSVYCQYWIDRKGPVPATNTHPYPHHATPPRDASWRLFLCSFTVAYRRVAAARRGSRYRVTTQDVDLLLRAFLAVLPATSSSIPPCPSRNSMSDAPLSARDAFPAFGASDLRAVTSGDPNTMWHPLLELERKR